MRLFPREIMELEDCDDLGATGRTVCEHRLEAAATRIDAHHTNARALELWQRLHLLREIKKAVQHQTNIN